MLHGRPALLAGLLAPPPPLAEPVHACVPVAPHLSVRAHYRVGTGSRVEARCDRLSVWSPEGGTRLLDPRTGATSERLTRDARNDVTVDVLLSTSALAFWNDTKLEAVDGIDLKPRWSEPRADHGLVFSAGSLLIEQSGKACSPTCAILAHDAATGREAWRRACPCDEAHAQGIGTPELYQAMTEGEGKIIATQGSARGIDVWDASDGRALWEKRDLQGEVVGKFTRRRSKRAAASGSASASRPRATRSCSGPPPHGRRDRQPQRTVRGEPRSRARVPRVRFRTPDG